jgi:dienelactone hydrolase
MFGRFPALIAIAVLVAATQTSAGSPASGIVKRAVSLRSGDHVITGELVSGTAKGPHPGVLFVHWLGDPKTTNHIEFEQDAVALARRGVTSLLVDAMWSDPSWFDKVGTSADADVAQARSQVADLRKALDLLETQKGVDPNRIAYVGHDLGAMFGALLAAEDSRPKVFVLMAGVPTLSEWYLLGKPHPEGYVAALDKLDITGSLAKSKAKAMLFQFAAHDKYITPDRASAFAASAPLPHGVFTYDADHSLQVPAAFADRQAWLQEQLFAGR